MAFDLGALRIPLLLTLIALASEKFIYYGALPLSDFIAGRFDCEMAQMETARGDDQNALLWIRAALLRSRTTPQFWRLAAEISGRQHSPEEIYCWCELDRLSPDSSTTQLALARAALRFQQLEVAAAALREVDPANQVRWDFLCAAGSLAEALGEKEEARQDFSRLEAAHPADAASLLVLAKWHAGLGIPSERAIARRLLLPLTRSPDVVPDILREVAGIALAGGDRAEARQWSDMLQRSGADDVTDRMQRLDILQGVDFNVELKALMSSTKPGEIAPVIDWMVRHDRGEQALIWMQRLPRKLVDAPTLARAHADCLSALGLWTRLRDVESSVPFESTHEHQRLMFLARAQFELGNDAAARVTWSEAVQACREYADFLALLDYLKRNNLVQSNAPTWAGARREVWLGMAARYPNQAWLERALLEDAIARRDSREVQECCRRLAAMDPQDVDVSALGARVSLLRGSRVEETSAALKKLQAAHPDNAEVTTARAFDYFREGRFADALVLFGGLPSEEMNASARAPYLAALLAVAGPVSQARAHLLVANAQPNLLDEEIALNRRSAQMISYRETMGKALRGADDGLDDPVVADNAPALVIQSVKLARVGRDAEAANIVARIEPATLDAAELTAYLGAVYEISGEHAKAIPCLELSVDIPFASNLARLHQAAEAWWACREEGLEAARFAGLLATYHALNRDESAATFWSGDEARDLLLLRRELAKGNAVETAQSWLQILSRHLSATPEIEALQAYALLRQGEPLAARTRMEMLPPAELEQPEISFYYGVILAANGERQAGRKRIARAGNAYLLPEEQALAAQVESAP